MGEAAAATAASSTCRLAACGLTALPQCGDCPHAAGRIVAAGSSQSGGPVSAGAVGGVWHGACSATPALQLDATRAGGGTK